MSLVCEQCSKEIDGPAPQIDRPMLHYHGRCYLAMLENWPAQTETPETPHDPEPPPAPEP